jgi:hypothetical protein
LYETALCLTGDNTANPIISFRIALSVGHFSSNYTFSFHKTVHILKLFIPLFWDSGDTARTYRISTTFQKLE